MSEHVRFVQKFLRSHIRKRTRISRAQIEVFLRNLEWVIQGIRPAFSPEGISLPDDALLELIEEVVPVIGGANNTNDLCMLSLKDDRFIASMKLCKQNFQKLASPQQLDTIFVDISKTHMKPKIADYKDLTCIQQTAKACLNAMSCATDSNKISNIQLVEQNTNLCTLFGCILGYPVIYYIQGSEGENCLSMVPLNVVKILEKNDSKQLLSFSYPASLEGHIKPAVTTWCEDFAKKDKTIAIQEETIEMPYVVL